MPGMWDWLDLIDSGPAPTTGPALAPLGVLANAEKPAIGNPLIAMQVANARAANPRPDISNSFVDPTWTQAYQTLVSALQQHFPVPALTQAMSPQQRYEASMPVRQAGINYAMSFGPLMTYNAGPKAVAQMATEYRGSHKSPSPTYGAPLHDLTAGDLIPADIYSNMAGRYYGTGNASLDAATLRQFHALRGKPEATVSIYRAVPKDAPATINSGDWVTINKAYAKMHGEGPLNGSYKIVEKKVPAKSLWTSLDSIHEFGYHPE